MTFPPDWTLSQYAAVGRHVVSYAAGAVTVGAAWGLVSQQDANGIVSNLNLVAHGVGEILTGLAGLGATASSVWAAMRAVRNSSPKEQMTSVVTQLSAPQVVQTANAIADPEGRNKLINAVGEMPEVKKIVADTDVSLATPSPKVVSELPVRNQMRQ